ncbi:MAG: iron ABC transporter permease [Flavobacteriales bacterium]|nr:iron ABC transporter permease [Flavobacteriales bacterium]
MTRAARIGITSLAVLLAGPLLVVLSAPLHTPAPEWEHVLGNLLWSQLGETLLLLAIALATALLIAVPCAWLVALFDFPLRRFVGWALVLPMALPTYIAAYTWAALLGPTGSMSLWLQSHFGVKPDILNLPGLGVVLGLVLYPYIYLPARAAFARGMTAQFDAARLLGAEGESLFRRVAVPLARPAIAAGALLLCMEVMNDYGAVKYYGVRTLTTGMFRSWGGLHDLGSSLRIGIVLVALVGVLIWIERRSRRHASTATDQAPIERRKLCGIEGWMAFAACMVVLLIACGLPMSKIIGDAWASWGINDHVGLMLALGRTLLLALGAVVLTLIIAIFFAHRERHSPRSSIAIRAANLGYAIPGAVIAIGAMVLVGPVDRSGWGGPVLIGSIGLLLYAYCARFLAVGTQPLFGAMRAQSASLDEAALLLGASTWRTFLRINLPLLRPALLGAGILVAVDVIKELPLTLILRPFDFETLGTSAYRYAVNEQLREAALPALLIVLCAVVPLFVLERQLRRVQR